MAPDSTKLTLMRRRILEVAAQVAAEGAHYLWGTNGDIPGAPNSPLTFAPPELSTDDNKDLAFCAAWNHVEHKVFVCAGRCRAVTSKPEVWIPKGDQRLEAFLATNGNKSFYHWGTDLTPRRVHGSGDGTPVDYTGRASYADDVKNNKIAATDPRATGNLDGIVVWGEGCDDTRHFDCYGFVSWVVKQACGVTIERGKPIPTQKNPVGEPIGILVDASDPGLPADIIVYPGHIAFATNPAVSRQSTDEHGKPVTVTSYTLAQAESAVYGVTSGKQRSDAPSYRVRLTDSTLGYRL